jgi:hypothetical protein
MLPSLRKEDLMALNKYYREYYGWEPEKQRFYPRPGNNFQRTGLPREYLTKKQKEHIKKTQKKFDFDAETKIPDNQE